MANSPVLISGRNYLCSYICSFSCFSLPFMGISVVDTLVKKGKNNILIHNGPSIICRIFYATCKPCTDGIICTIKPGIFLKPCHLQSNYRPRYPLPNHKHRRLFGFYSLKSLSFFNYFGQHSF